MNNVKYVLRVYKERENPVCKRHSVPRLPCFERVGGVRGGAALEGVVNNPFATFLLLLLSPFFLRAEKEGAIFFPRLLGARIWTDFFVEQSSKDKRFEEN